MFYRKKKEKDGIREAEIREYVAEVRERKKEGGRCRGTQRVCD